MKVTITTEHIQNGKKGSCLWCPVALALNDTLGRRFNVQVHVAWPLGADNLLRSGCAWKVALDLPIEVTDFIYKFDSGRPVGPLTFEVNG